MWETRGGKVWWWWLVVATTRLGSTRALVQPTLTRAERLIKWTEEAKMEERPSLLRWVSSSRRYGLLTQVLREDPLGEYVELAGMLHLVYGVERTDLPNVENVPHRADSGTTNPLASCDVKNATYSETPLDTLLLSLTRKRYAANKPIESAESSQDGILGLLEEMVSQVRAGATNEQQKNLVVQVLRDLMTPFLPPIYKTFVTNTPWQDFATALVAPFVFGYLVGPATVNYRSDGNPGGLSVTKCKFLQESNCKGLCLHQCKLPAEALFKRDLGVDLYVRPNFLTHECQWSWGLKAPDPLTDPNWPSGCIAVCPTRDLQDGVLRASQSSQPDPDFCL